MDVSYSSNKSRNVLHKLQFLSLETFQQASEEELRRKEKEKRRQRRREKKQREKAKKEKESLNSTKSPDEQGSAPQFQKLEKSNKSAVLVNRPSSVLIKLHGLNF